MIKKLTLAVILSALILIPVVYLEVENQAYVHEDVFVLGVYYRDTAYPDYYNYQARLCLEPVETYNDVIVCSGIEVVPVNVIYGLPDKVVDRATISELRGGITGLVYDRRISFIYQ